MNDVFSKQVEGSRFVKEFVESIISKKDYRISVDFDFDLIELKEHLKSRGSFSTDGIFVIPNEFTEIEKKAIKIANTLAQTDQHLWENVDEIFPTGECVYDDIVFSLMFGQGTLYSFRLV